MRSHSLCIFSCDTSHLKNLPNSLWSQRRNTKMLLDEAQKAEVLAALNVAFLSEAASPRAETAEPHGSSPVSYLFTALHIKAKQPWLWVVPWVWCNPQLVQAHLGHFYGEGRNCQKKGGFPSIAGRRNLFSRLIPLLFPGLPYCNSPCSYGFLLLNPWIPYVFWLSITHHVSLHTVTC